MRSVTDDLNGGVPLSPTPGERGGGVEVGFGVLGCWSCHPGCPLQVHGVHVVVVDFDLRHTWPHLGTHYSQLPTADVIIETDGITTKPFSESVVMKGCRQQDGLTLPVVIWHFLYVPANMLLT